MTRRFRGVAYVVALCNLTLAAAGGFLRASYPAPTRHSAWPPNLRADFAATDAATPGVAGGERHLSEAGARRVAELVVAWILELPPPTLRPRP